MKELIWDDELRESESEGKGVRKETFLTGI